MKKRWLMAFLLALILSSSCKLLGLWSVEEACYECCKKKLNYLVRRGRLTSQVGFRNREGCTERCQEQADKAKKDAYWVEEHEACLQ